VTAVQADKSCVRITPEAENATYVDDDDLPEPRSMGQLIYLPDETMVLLNGVSMGTAGYGLEHLSIGESYGQAPVYMPAMYDPNAPPGSRFTRDGLTSSAHERMYHSSATLLPDSSVLVSGSNPNADVSFVQWATSYTTERFYPTWYSSPRPVPSLLPDSLSYGGEAWNLTYTPTNSSSDPGATKVVVIRTGFSTHCMNFGQRYLELATSYTQDQTSGQVTMHVSQMPPNPNIFAPGNALIFLVVDGIPSIGQMIMIGSGQIETQPLALATVLPPSSVIVDASSNSSSGGDSGSSNASSNSSSKMSSTSGMDKTAGAGAAWLPLLPCALALLIVACGAAGL